MKPLYFNGKFLTAAPTGVHRVAEELIQATDRLLATQPDAPETIILTPATEAKAASLTRTRVVHTPFLSGIAKNIPWAHFALPWSARKGRLISLCNLLINQFQLFLESLNLIRNLLHLCPDLVFLGSGQADLCFLQLKV